MDGAGPPERQGGLPTRGRVQEPPSGGPGRPQFPHGPSAGLRGPALPSGSPSAPAPAPGPSGIAPPRKTRRGQRPAARAVRLQAALSRGRGDERRPTRGLQGTLLRGYSRSSRRSGRRPCCWRSARGVRRRPFGWRRRGDRIRAGRSCVLRPRRYHETGPPSRPARGSLSSLSLAPRRPRARHRWVAGSQAPGPFRRGGAGGPRSLRARVASPRLRQDGALCPLGLGQGEGLPRNPGRVPVARPGCLHWHTPPFSLPGRPQPRGRVLPVHPKCLRRSPRFGLWRRSGFCEPRRPRSPGSRARAPPPRASSGSGALPRDGDRAAFLRRPPRPPARRSCGLCVAAAVTHLLPACGDLGGRSPWPCALDPILQLALKVCSQEQWGTIFAFDSTSFACQ